ncbi:MAG: tetratricopeptide repeat protein [Acidobacteriota bacterium]
MSGETPSKQFLDSLCEEIRRTVSAGRLDKALILAEEAIDLAEATGDPVEIDRMVCNLGAIQVARDEGETVTPRLRRILMSSTDPANRFNAAYAIAQHHERIDEIERGQFYANAAVGYAEKCGDPASLARAYNQVGNLQLVRSYFEEASQNYAKALALVDEPETLELAILLSNLGYCQTVLGDFDSSFVSLSRSHRILRDLRADRWLHLPLLGLSFAYLEVGQYAEAEGHAQRALELAESASYQDNQVKNALYLLGEATKLAGKDEESYQHICHLQQRFYPDQPMVVDVLVATDIRKLINLMA